MMKKLMARCALLGAAVLFMTACFTGQDYSSQYDYQILVQFEPDQEYQWEEFAMTFFNSGKDTVSFPETFSVGPICHFAKLSGDGSLLGGFALACGKDSDASEGRKPSWFAVFDKDGGHLGSKAYAVFHDTTATLMPEHSVQIVLPNADSYCEAKVMYVHNVQAVYQAVKTGAGLAGGPFKEDDYLVLTVTGYKGTSQTGKTEVKLVNGTNAVVEWTEVDLTPLGKADTIDMHLSSSRSDLPLYCCVDNMGYHYLEIYK